MRQGNDMKRPHSDQGIIIRHAQVLITAKLGDTLIARSNAALELKEANYPIVYYFPRQDVAISALTITQHHTHCPFKGDASHYTVRAGEQIVENAAWSYETPIASVDQIAGHVALKWHRLLFLNNL